MSETKLIPKETLDDYSNNLKFDNMYNELEFYKSKCEVYEKDLFKSQTQIKKLELAIKKMQEINTLNAKVKRIYNKEHQQHFYSVLSAFRI